MLIGSYPGEDEVDQTKPEGRDQSITLTGASLSEHCGTVEGFKTLIKIRSNEILMLTNDVDTTLLQVSAFSRYTSLQYWSTYHLLGDHDNETGKCGTPHARNGE